MSGPESFESGYIIENTADTALCEVLSQLNGTYAEKRDKLNGIITEIRNGYEG